MSMNDAPTLQEWAKTAPKGFDHKPKDAGDIPPPLELDPQKYAPLIAEFGLTELQGHELLATLWAAMSVFVDLGLDIGKADFCGWIFSEFNQVSAPESGSATVPMQEPMGDGIEYE